MQNNDVKRSPELYWQVEARLRVETGGGGEEGRTRDSSLIDIHKPSRSRLQVSTPKQEPDTNGTQHHNGILQDFNITASRFFGMDADLCLQPGHRECYQENGRCQQLVRFLPGHAPTTPTI